MSGPETGCAALRDVAAELAVGALSGGERATAVSHLSICPSCQQLMGELTGIADGLLLLAPEIEPPPGFESRVMARLVEPARIRRPRLRSLAAVAAAVVLAAAGGAIAAGVVADDAGPPQLRTDLVFSESGRTTCQVVVTGGSPANLLIYLDGSSGRSTEYTAEAQPARGPAIPLGRFALADGRGALSTTLDIDGKDLASVRVFAMDGELLYEAFPAPTPSSDRR